MNLDRFVHVETSVSEAKRAIEHFLFLQGRTRGATAPKLTCNGVLYGPDVTTRMKKDGVSRQDAQALLLKDFEDKMLHTDEFNRQVGACLDVLKIVRANSMQKGGKVKVGSYGMKHLIEHFFRAIYTPIYIPNTAMIVAAYSMDVNIKLNDSPNIEFSVNKKTLNSLQSLERLVDSRGDERNFGRYMTGPEFVLAHLGRRLKDYASAATSPRQP